MKRTLFMIALLATACNLQGCASYLQAATAANTSAVVSVRAAADLSVKVNAEAFCTMSVDTLGRNTQYVKAVQSLCWSGSVTTPSDAAAALPVAVPVVVQTPAVGGVAGK